MSHIRIAVASDTHIGARRSRVPLLHAEWERLYERDRPKQFLLLGDLFDDFAHDVMEGNGTFSERKFLKLPRPHRAFLEFLVHLHERAWHDRTPDGGYFEGVVVTPGNHDGYGNRKLRQGLTPLIPYNITDAFRFSAGGVDWIGMHGHQFDREWAHNPRLSYYVSRFFRVLQALDGKDPQRARWLDEHANTGRRNYMRRVIPQKMAVYAQKAHVKHTLSGHIHIAVECQLIDPSDPTALVESDSPGMCTYGNPGNWVDRKECSYMTIRTDGTRALHRFPV